MRHTDPIEARAAAEAAASLRQLNERSREVFKRIVESYLATGEPVGSRNLSRALPMTLSPASVRNVMSDLESLGLIYAPHTSAGRLPTQTGLRLFIDGLLEVGDISVEERSQIESRIAGSGRRRAVEDVLGEAGEMLSGLSRCAGVVLVDKQSKKLKHVEFVNLGPGASAGGAGRRRRRRREPHHHAARGAAAVLAAGGFELPQCPHRRADLGRGPHPHRDGDRGAARAARRADRAASSPKVLPPGRAQADDRQSLIVCGRAHLLEDVRAMEDLERVRLLFEDLDTKTDLIQLLGLAERAEGVRIFIGSENKLFSLSGSALIVSPFEDTEQKIVGVLGVIGPTRLNYARIIPMVDYTAKLLGRLVP